MGMNGVLADKKKMWSIVSLLVLFAFAFFLLFKYDFGNYRKIKASLGRIELNKATLNSLSGHEKRLKELSSSLTAEHDVNWLMETLTNISKESGVFLNAVKPMGTDVSLGYSIAKVSIKGKTPYKNLLRLIKNIEGSNEMIFIDSIFLMSSAGEYAPAEKSSREDVAKTESGGKSIDFQAVIKSVAKQI